MEAETILRDVIERMEEKAKESKSAFSGACSEGCRYYIQEGRMHHDPTCPYWSARRFLDGVSR